MGNEVQFRVAEREDTPLILEFIKALAEYEKMSNDVVADEALLEEWTTFRVTGDTLKNLAE